jgi:hypothetical protein
MSEQFKNFSLAFKIFFAFVANVELPVIVEGEVGPTSKRFLVV